MKRCRPMEFAQANPSSTIWAAVKTSPSLPVELVVDGMVVGREEVEELDGQPLLFGQLRAPGSDEARDVLVGDGVVLPRLHAGLALAQLGAADPQELEDPAPEEGLLPPGAACRVGHEDLRRLVGEDLQWDRRGIRAVRHPLLDDPPRLRRQLLQRNRLDSRHAHPPALAGMAGVERSPATTDLLYCHLVPIDPSSVLLTDRVAVVTGGGSGIGRGHRPRFRRLRGEGRHLGAQRRHRGRRRRGGRRPRAPHRRAGVRRGGSRPGADRGRAGTR